ncbi:MAG TPA: M20/M25/M40 family metallo-hydrolase [Bryobacteraceae bacterium]|nr:M20/M25/M40 family metallo-hydrolase [Bryobacteraceae bacterium]
MNVFELTRALIDIESITNNEEGVGTFLFEHLSSLARRFGGQVERMDVEPRRFNVFAQWGKRLTVTLSTHMDTVPPFFISREDDEHVWGRGACDTKGIIACMITAAERMLEAGERDFGLLFVVGEERNSAGAYRAAQLPRGSSYIINGEPTGNLLALGSKGALRYEVAATGRMAHSAYPELGDSAIHKLIEVLADMRRIELPVDPLLGPSTLNIGTLSGGRAPNVIADEARADIMIRLVGDSSDTKRALEHAAEGRAELREVIEIPALRLNSFDGIETTVVAYTTDIPAFGGQWGEPFLIGPGSIHVAHTLEERVPKAELLEAVSIYQRMVRNLCKRELKSAS